MSERAGRIIFAAVGLGWAILAVIRLANHTHASNSATTAGALFVCAVMPWSPWPWQKGQRPWGPSDSVPLSVDRK